MESELKQKKVPWNWYVVAILSAAAIVYLTLLFPIWNWFPVQITEEITVIAVAEVGCVTDAVSMNHPVVISDCNAQPGDIIEATYYVPAIETGDYYQKLQQKADLVNP